MLSVYVNDRKIVDEVGKADRFFSRFLGLMFKKKMNDNQGLLIIPCNQIHTFNMRFDIDVLFISKENKIVHIEHSMKPGRATKMIKGSHSVLELCSGISEKNGVKIGDMLTFETNQ